jgi:hypothetical protein
MYIVFFVDLADETPAKRTKVANPKKTKAQGKRAYKTDGLKHIWLNTH